MYVSIETDLLSDSEQDLVETALTTNLYECSELVKRGKSDLKSHTNTEKIYLGCTIDPKLFLTRSDNTRVIYCSANKIRVQT